MQRLIVAITGASGAIYGIRALEISAPSAASRPTSSSPRPAGGTIAEETDLALAEVHALAHQVHGYRDIGAAISSGSFQTSGMLVAPCSAKTLSGLAHCFDDDLVVRAADVCLKERRLVLLFRETPLHAGHIALMEQATRNGAIVMPPMPAFYPRPQSIAEMVTQTVGRALDLLGLDARLVKRWKDPPPSLDEAAE